MDSLLRRIRGAGFRRVLRGEHWAWLVLSIATHLLYRTRKQKNALVSSIPIEPGDTLVISLREPQDAPEPVHA